MTIPMVCYNYTVTTLNFIYALLAGLLPSFIWLYFWSREDLLHPEPRALLAAAFLGGSLAVVAAIFAEKYVGTLVTDISSRYIFWATIEEVAKFASVALVALWSKSNDEPIDAMIYCITAALGFAALENLLFVMGPLSSGNVSVGVLTGNMRFMGATLVHIVSSALIGFSLGFTFYKPRIVKYTAAIVGILLASGLHAAFNLSIISSAASDALKTFAWIWGATVILIILFEEVKAVKPRWSS
ncbi:MAG: PrsW family glutamic-type intramembrane protease [Patescibacteria group bacterium]